jgi:hypothetical protein
VSQQAASSSPSEQLRILAYRDGQLIRADVPLWCLRLKQPALSLVFRDTGFDPVEAGWTAAELVRAGSGLLLDQEVAGGGRIIVWTEAETS